MQTTVSTLAVIYAPNLGRLQFKKEKMVYETYI